jgi:hypothetical protein
MSGKGNSVEGTNPREGSVMERKEKPAGTGFNKRASENDGNDIQEQH